MVYQWWNLLELTPDKVIQSTGSKSKMPGDPLCGLWPCLDQGVIPVGFARADQPWYRYTLIMLLLLPGISDIESKLDEHNKIAGPPCFPKWPLPVLAERQREDRLKANEAGPLTMV